MWIPCFPIRKSENHVTHFSRGGNSYVHVYVNNDPIWYWDPEYCFLREQYE